LQFVSRRGVGTRQGDFIPAISTIHPTPLCLLRLIGLISAISRCKLTVFPFLPDEKNSFIGRYPAANAYLCFRKNVNKWKKE